ncbi:nuclear transport factor 2 family protein [Starkeya koreensis]|uniref:Nuclear transport factor 2 family protein n=1 Tax=Ancylobacter koreensis TaxID=266121 RepID=A0ABT0DHY8_9HYPH|nr:nuclear transport factor 2 family protein [Ancylobacter koreensis]MCK0206891.1 nuclear transport factor 2 family protein [Ancylobacter koreensis]
MIPDLPGPVAAYFQADRLGPDAVARCFTPDGTVTDEKSRHAGHDAIRRWKAMASAKYRYTSEPVSFVGEDGRILVTARVAGDFPGSPVQLRYAFTLDGDRIAALEIVP